MHADHAAVERLREKAARKGVTDLAPGWLVHNDVVGVWYEHDESITDDAAALIVTGSLSAWLAGQGITVVYDPITSKWTVLNLSKGWSRDLSATDHLSALLAATNARLDEMPDKPAPSAPPPASKEHP